MYPLESLSFFWSGLMLYFFFCIYFLKHLGTYSSWRLTLLGTFIFSEFFHLWVQAFYCMLLAIFFRTTGFQLNTINWIPRHISLETTKKFKVSVVFESNFGQNYVQYCERSKETGIINKFFIFYIGNTFSRKKAVVVKNMSGNLRQI